MTNTADFPLSDNPAINATNDLMRADGLPVDTQVQVDYFGFGEAHRVVLPDGVSWIEHTTFNEGMKREFQNKSNRDLRIEKSSGDAKMRLEPGTERKLLLQMAISGWNLSAGGKPVPFNPGSLERLLSTGDPKMLDLVEKDIRIKNPWLLSDMSVEDIDKEIATLQELREVRVKEDAKKL